VTREATMDIIRGERTILVATDAGLHIFEIDNGAGASEARRVDDLTGHEVIALESNGGGPWAVVDGRELWRRGSGGGCPGASTRRRKATCVAATAGGLLVGTTRAHLLRLDDERLTAISSFDRAEGRDAWHTPWGAPADVRSISAARDGAVYVNVHVGGVLRS